jgi:hypothetical protein
VLIEHLTLGTMSQYPEMVDSEVQNVCLVTDQNEGERIEYCEREP